MIKLWVLLFVSVFLAYLSARNSRRKIRGWKMDIFSWLLVLVLTFFAGLRTSFNDTRTYVNNFEEKVPTLSGYIDNFQFSLPNNPGFELYQVIIKNSIADSANMLFLISAFIIVFITVRYYKKYSPNFTVSILLYITFTGYIFSLAGLKQALAMALLLTTLPLIEKRQWMKFSIIVIIVSTIHLFALLFLLVPFFSGEPWGKRTYFALAGILAIGAFFSLFVSFMSTGFAAMGETYTAEDLLGAGVSFPRLFVYSIVPLLSWIFRKKLFRNKDSVLYLSVNLSIISFLFMILASFGSAFLFTRVAIYFSLSTAVALPMIIDRIVKKNSQIIVYSIAGVLFCVFFNFEFAKYRAIGLTDFFNHVSIFDIL